VFEAPSPTGDSDIYGGDDSGTVFVNLTRDPGVDYDARWSADGAKLLFTSDRTGNSDIYVLNANGSALTNATCHPGNDFAATWFPDGKTIAFVSDRSGHKQLYLMDADGSRQRRLTDDVYDDPPSVSPDGATILFTARVGGVLQIFAIGTDGSGRRALTSGPTGHWSPRWSPRGDHIAYIEFPGIYDQHLIVADPDGTRAVDLTVDTISTEKRVDYNPAFSRDGSRIAFGWQRSALGGRYDLYVATTDGTTTVNLTNDDAKDVEWSADGTRLFFVTGFEQFTSIYVINADGTNQKGFSCCRRPRVRPRN
jgi:TolB protein